jgi:hypothetical protein
MRFARFETLKTVKNRYATFISGRGKYNDDLHFHSKRLTCFKAVFLNVLAAESKEGLHTDIETGLAVLKRTNVKP